MFLIRRDLKCVWKMRGGDALDGATLWGAWLCSGGDDDDGSGHGSGDDGPPCLLLMMTIGGRVVVMATSSLGFCHELLQ